MKIRRTAHFDRNYRRAPQEIQQAFDKQSLLLLGVFISSSKETPTSCRPSLATRNDFPWGFVAPPYGPVLGKQTEQAFSLAESTACVFNRDAPVYTVSGGWTDVAGTNWVRSVKRCLGCGSSLKLASFWHLPSGPHRRAAGLRKRDLASFRYLRRRPPCPETR